MQLMIVAGGALVSAKKKRPLGRGAFCRVTWGSWGSLIRPVVPWGRGAAGDLFYRTIV